MPYNYPTNVTTQASKVWGGDGTQAVDVPVGPGGTAVMGAPTVPAARNTLAYGTPSTEAVDRELLDADDGATLICSGIRIFTVNMGRVAGFGLAFKGACSFVGTATISDVRVPGVLNPWCALVQTGVDTYDLVGGVL